VAVGHTGVLYLQRGDGTVAGFDVAEVLNLVDCTRPDGWMTRRLRMRATETTALIVTTNMPLSEWFQTLFCLSSISSRYWLCKIFFIARQVTSPALRSKRVTVKICNGSVFALRIVRRKNGAAGRCAQIVPALCASACFDLFGLT
jgi:hypothetical protein